MGNNCVAGGGAPTRADITVVNNTKYELTLNPDEKCGRECDCFGWQVTAGKIVEGHEPPATIQPFASGRFSVAGREGSAVAPNGKVFYVNQEKNLKVICEWSGAGVTTMSSSSASISITGIPPPGGLLSAAPKPWEQVLEGEADATSWIFSIRKREGHLTELRKTANKLQDFKVGLT